MILLTLFRMGRGQVRPRFNFLFVLFFLFEVQPWIFVNFVFMLWDVFYPIFTAIASSGQKLFQTTWKNAKKDQKSQHLLKREPDKKEHIKLPIFFAQTFHTSLI